jgi:tryptophan synthase alpha chain
MSAISDKITAAKAASRAAFIPYVTGGFPDDSICLELIKAMDRAGADIIEVGIPFSDPLADGPTIQHASKLALDNGTTPQSVLAICEKAKDQVSAALVVMTYVNPVVRMGYGEFAKAAAKAGISGVIIPDLPPEEGANWISSAGEAGLDPIFMAAPTTPSRRVSQVSSHSKGFLYYVSMTGVTGTSLALGDETTKHLKRVREASQLPVAVGFGIQRPEQAAALAPLCDGVVVGSALVKKMIDAGAPEQGVEQAFALAQGIGRACAY